MKHDTVYETTNYSMLCQQGVGGVMVSIVAFQAVDPGSIPGQRIAFFPLIMKKIIIIIKLIYYNF